MSEEPPTVDSVSLYIFQNLLQDIVQTLVTTLDRKEKTLKYHYGSVQPFRPGVSKDFNSKRIAFNEQSNLNNLDIFGLAKTNDAATYFTCDNCGRKVSGNRFAAHLDRCLGGRNRTAL